MGVSGTVMAVAAAIGAGATVYSAMNQPDAPKIQAPGKPQVSQVPDAAGTRQSLAGMGQGGGSPGIAQTFLSGTGGVDPSLLQLGRNTLLGGGTGSSSMPPPPGMG